MVFIWLVITCAFFLYSISWACFSYSDYIIFETKSDLRHLQFALIIAALCWSWPVSLPLAAVYFISKMVKTALTGKV